MRRKNGIFMRVCSVLLITCMLCGVFEMYDVNAKTTEFDEIAQSTAMPSYLYGVIGENTWLFQTKEYKTRIVHSATAESWERLNVKQIFQPEHQEINFIFEDIETNVSNYSFAVCIGNIKNQWYDQNGYMFLYDADGDFAIIETENTGDSTYTDPNLTKVFHTDSLESVKSGRDMSFKISLLDEVYQVNVGGEIYEIPAAGDICPISNPSNLNLSFGIVSGFDIKSEGENGIIQNLNYWGTTGEVSFTLDYRKLMPNLDVKHNLLPNANIAAAFAGEQTEYVTRREAVTEIAKLMVKEEHIADVFSSDFQDISEEDYDLIAYMERFGLLPYEGDKFYPERIVKQGELRQMLGFQNDLNSSRKLTRADARAILREHPDYADAVTEVVYQVSNTPELVNKINEAITQTTYSKVVLELTGSEYSLTESIQIDELAQQSDVELVIRNAEGIEPVITSNKKIEGTFAQVQGQNYYQYAFGSGEKPEFRDLYYNGERMQLAKSDIYTFEKGHAVQDSNGNVTGYENSFYIDSSLISGISEIAQLELCMNIDWMYKRYRIASIGNTKNGLTSVTVKNEEWQAYLEGDGNKKDSLHWNYQLENHLSLLDEPGEFYYDKAEGVLYVYPYKGVDINSAEISYPMAETLFYLRDCKGITFEGITFTGITSNFANDYGFNGELGGVYNGGEGKYEHIHAAAVYGENTSHINFLNCKFWELGTNGIYLNDGNSNILMQGNSFTNLAMSAVVLGNYSGKWNQRDGQWNAVIDNNYIENIGMSYPNTPAICVGFVKNIGITHNTIRHTPYSGVSLGWVNDLPSATVSVHNAEIAHNYLEDNMYAMNDGAALYFGGINGFTTDTTIYNRVHDNYIKGSGYNKTYTGIYLDMNASNYDVYHNVIDGIVTTHTPIYNQSLSSQRTYNNILRENYTTMSPIEGENAQCGIVVYNNQMVATAEELPTKAKEIVAKAGQMESFHESDLGGSTQIRMLVQEPHISLNVGEKSKSDAVNFEIQNNSSVEQTYTITHSNLDENKISFTADQSQLILQAGETGYLKGYLSSTTENGYVEQWMDFSIRDARGKTYDFYRVIGVTVGNAVYRATRKPSFTQNSSGTEVSGASKNYFLSYATEYYLKDTGVSIELTNISLSSNDNAITMMFGNSYDGWYNSQGYMLIYKQNGEFSIIATGESITDLEQIPESSIIVSETRETGPGTTLSVYVKAKEDSYELVVNGKPYTIPCESETMSEAYFSFGGLTENWLGTGQASFTIADISYAATTELSVGGGETNETLVTVHDGGILPTKYYEDKYIIGWTDDTVFDISRASEYVAEFIDLNMLDLYVQKNLKQENLYRFIGSVDNTEDYVEKGFVLSSKNSEPTCEDSWYYASQGYYVGIKETYNGQTYKRTVSDIYQNDYSNRIFVTAFKLSMESATSYIYARAYVKLSDGTIVYGETAKIKRTEIYDEDAEMDNDIPSVDI